MEPYVQEVNCEDVRVSPFQPRTFFADEEIKELAASIKQTGLIQPPVVRKIESNNTLLYYELIAGERRLRAAKEAGLTKIAVIVRNASDHEAAKATLIENIQRIDLDPLETARAFAKLMDTFKMTQEQIAEKVGKKRSTIANYLRLLSLPKPIQEAIEKKEITMGHAKALLSLSDPSLQEALHHKIVDQTLSVREAEKQGRTLQKPVKSKDPHIQELQDTLAEQFKTKVTFTTNKQGGGVLSLHCYDADHLETLLNQLLSLR